MNVNKYYGLGKRKEAVAKVYLFSKGSGKIEIVTGRYKNYQTRNGLDYFKNEFLIKNINLPIKIVKNDEKYDIRAHVKGGGLVSQAQAIKLGIAYALLAENPESKSVIKMNKLLTQDKRFKERKKIGKYGARRSPQFTKR